ncbi:hypothetical protein ASPACDRAFT_1860602 [Aspergillus aculeatus ATCC 16872]|uniref:DUF6536 domain-containing protein n=1 Tax=Aspergillus aculeatus (strain ATCC 16872 / CBS 172.66 / WB 5094) TaxID=690307 RepID=A0A1L9WFG6_ASPA1|nr:uncharacterized protein ASPACDRAFT_1860602 [Aspergillus aculeatus ATCC 16872]OJJ94921.1 hypothetical protein ASPACDRAFT_1860602 [Aspergillus aculeatus ATCC 16872]
MAMDSRHSVELICLPDPGPAHEDEPLLSPTSAARYPAILTPGISITNEDESEAENRKSDSSDDEAQNTLDTTYPRYASKRLLGQYIPEINEHHVRSTTRKSAASKQSTMLRNQFITAAVICLANVVTLICFWVFFPPDERGIGTIRMGDCAEMTSINSAAHVALNVLSSLFLGAGSYCMQILVAPSRREMDWAHARGVSLDIGVQSVRNLRWIKAGRLFQWLGLGVLSICLHLFWNSLTFTSTPVVSYATATVTIDFQTVGRDWALDPIPPTLSGKNWSAVHDLYTEMANFTRLDKQECIDAYIDGLTTKGPLVVVAANITAAQNYNHTLLDGWVTGWDVWSHAPWWICGAYNLPDYNRLCTREWASTFIDDWAVVAWAHQEKGQPGWPFWVKVDYCLVGAESDITQRCGLHYGTQIFAVVSACTLLQCGFILRAWWSYRTKSARRPTEKTMVLMGDAVAEYLEYPGDMSNSQVVRVYPQVWRPQKSVSWFNTIHRKVWAISFTLFMLGIAAPLAILVDSVVFWKGRGLDMSLPSIVQLGFGLNPGFLGMNSETSNYSLMDSSVSFLYLFYNNILTHQLVADQWVRFLRPDGKKALRVSTSRGMQRSSYLLSLPLTYSLTLTIAMILLHWLVSQSLFVVQTIGFDTNGEKVNFPHFSGSAVGYALSPIVLATLCGVVMVAGVLVHSLVRRHHDVPAGFPAWGASSAHIEALCSGRPADDVDAHLFPVSLGVVVSGPQDQPYLTFSTDTGLRPPERNEMLMLPARMARQKVSKGRESRSRRMWGSLKTDAEAGVLGLRR